MSEIPKQHIELEEILENPWDNVYWFARALINIDQFGGIGRNTEMMLKLATALKKVLEVTKKEPKDDIVKAASEVMKEVLLDRKKGTKKYKKVIQLCDFLEEKLLQPEDFKVLALTCEKVMVPINNSLEVIPNDDQIYAKSVASGILKAKGIEGLATIINVWDDLGKHGCLTAERVEAVRLFGNLRQYLAARVNEEEMDIILTAFAQEFERRIGQKRPGRAGRSVENVADFILNYFDIRASEGPEHFTAALEIDRWVKTSDNWLIGISCKRTLRERWKQVATTDVGLLNRHKIKEIWHLITYTSDLSDDKITEMGSHRAKIYLPDDDPILKRATSHPGLRNYVRGMTNFVEDLQEEVT